MDDKIKQDDRDPVARRLLILAALFAAWLLIALCRAWYFAVPDRSRYIAVSERMARREVVLPAPRGRIMDADGVLLAWSSRSFDLVSTAPEHSPLTDEEVAALKKVLPDINPAANTLRRDLSPGEAMGVEALIRTGVRVRIAGRHERVVIGSPQVRRLVGKVAPASGVIRGISGWEKEFDLELAGSPGLLSVMFDRDRNWIRQSVQVLKPMTPGRDVRVAKPLRELESAARGAENVR